MTSLTLFVYPKIVKPQPQTLSPQTPLTQPQPSLNNFKDPSSPKETGGDTKILIYWQAWV